MTKADIEKYIDDHAEKMHDELFDFLRMNSQRGPSEEGKPFGNGPYEALMAAKKLCEDYGFVTNSYDNAVVSADINPNGEEVLDILVHVDVVPGGEGWTETKPFEPVDKDGTIYGRGVADDKGGFIAALYALKAVKELGCISKRARLLIGTAEESHMVDLPYYYNKNKAAQFTFSPDAWFPIINAEKGRTECFFEADINDEPLGRSLVTLQGGGATNQIPPAAFAILKGVSVHDAKAPADIISKETGANFKISGDEDSLRIDCFGKSCHGAKPELGINSITALIKLILELDLYPCDGLNKIKGIYDLFPFGDYYAEHAGLKSEDEITGKTTSSLNIIRYDGKHLVVSVDLRTSRALDDRDLKAELTDLGNSIGLTFHTDESVKSHFVSPENKNIGVLKKHYEEVTGEKCETLSMGGITYTHHVENGVAFGPRFPGYDARNHGPNERLEFDFIKKAAVIYALCIEEICR
ncbi:MAG: Sapep family Mn(2+)-dependent dipeptidase [Eubacteriales bacterium]|nr:Sapep family Mn(2+)-dependent dipeptidase [Eubacteriales bacterium]